MTIEADEINVSLEKQKLSVIIPIYNVEPYICQCLDSIINQTYRNLEIILVDDGSPDNCGEICDEYAKKDKRITVIHKQNGGVQAARSDGMAIATGKWITFVDPDDWCETDYYEQLFTALGVQDADVFCSGGYYRELGKKTITVSGFRNTIIYCEEDKIKAFMVKALVPRYGDEANPWPNGYSALWDKIYKREFLKNSGVLFDTTCKAYDDIWFSFQLFDKAKKVGGCSYIGYHYRRIETSIVNGFNALKPMINYDFISKLNMYMSQRDPNDTIQQAIRIRSINVIINAMICYYYHPMNKKNYRKITFEINDMKTWPHFHDAIYNQNNQYMTRNQIIVKYLLRLPWVWPLKLACTIRLKMRR